MPAGRVLIIEDEDKLRRVIQLHLSSAGFEVDTAASAEQAMPMLEQADVILTDLRLPGSSGLGVVLEQFFVFMEQSHCGQPKSSGREDGLSHAIVAATTAHIGAR